MTPLGGDDKVHPNFEMAIETEFPPSAGFLKLSRDLFSEQLSPNLCFYGSLATDVTIILKFPYKCRCFEL